MSAFDEQGRFQAVVVEPVDGQEESLMVRLRIAREMLKASSYTCEAMLICEMMFSRASSSESNSAVYEQSVATPIMATRLVDGHPLVCPITSTGSIWPIPFCRRTRSTNP